MAAVGAPLGRPALTVRPRYTDDAIVLHGVLTQEMPFLEKPFTVVSLLAKAREVLRPASEPPREE